MLKNKLENWYLIFYVPQIHFFMMLINSKYYGNNDENNEKLEEC